MSRVLSELLGVNKTLLETDLKRLELASGHPSIDVRLSVDILSKARQKTRELGLDPRDTTGRELYHGLLGLVRLHDQFLAKRIGATDPSDVADVLPRIRQAVLSAKFPKTAWVMKASVAKRLLKDDPPKKLMKYLGYKSLDSMLKRESICDLYAGLQLLESRHWQENFISRYQSLTQMDFETRKIEIRQLDTKKWGEAAAAYVQRQRHIIMHVRELGAIIMLPAPFKRRPGITIAVLPQLLHHVNEIRLYSAFYKLHQMQSNFGSIVARSLLFDHGNHILVAGQRVHWRVVQRHFGQKQTSGHPEIFEPHVQPDDLMWRQAEEVLFSMEPALHFWHGCDYVATLDDKQPVSFNLVDNALNYLNGIHYHDRLNFQFRDALHNELYLRYLGQPALETLALKQLDYETSATSLLTVAARGRK